MLIEGVGKGGRRLGGNGAMPRKATDLHGDLLSRFRYVQYTIKRAIGKGFFENIPVFLKIVLLFPRKRGKVGAKTGDRALFRAVSAAEADRI